MEPHERQAIVQTCRRLFRPVASFLLKCGMTWREFAEVSKSVFVEVASDEYGIQGRKTNISRVSILTGISRKEVKRQRDLLTAKKPPIPSKATDATRVLSGWHQDPDFLDQSNRPLTLTLEGEAGSFAALCDRYGGDAPASAMLKELKRVAAVRETEHGLEVCSRYYMPTQFDTQWVLSAGDVFRDLGMNINYNVTAGGDTPTRFLGRAMNEQIRVTDVRAFRNFIEKNGQHFLELVDDWLTAHETDAADGKQVRLGVGLFLIQDDEHKQG